jgi:hypothetical protein
VWQLLPERLACRLLDEALRVARTTFVLKDTRIRTEAGAWSGGLVAVHDSPYWERTHPVARSWFDFCFTPRGQAAPSFLYALTRAADASQNGARVRQPERIGTPDDG